MKSKTIDSIVQTVTTGYSALMIGLMIALPYNHNHSSVPPKKYWVDLAMPKSFNPFETDKQKKSKNKR